MSGPVLESLSEQECLALLKGVEVRAGGGGDT